MTSAHIGYSLYFSMGRDMPPQKNCPSPLRRGFGSSPNTLFLGPTQVHVANGISIGSVVLAKLMVMTNRQILRPWNTVTVGCSCAPSACDAA